MAANIIIGVQTAAANSANINIPAGSSVNYHASGLTVGDEPILVTLLNAAGGYTPARRNTETNDKEMMKLNYWNNFIQMVGPVDFLFEKPVTKGLVGVVSYS